MADRGRADLQAEVRGQVSLQRSLSQAFASALGQLLRKLEIVFLYWSQRKLDAVVDDVDASEHGWLDVLKRTKLGELERMELRIITSLARSSRCFDITIPR